MFDLFTHTNRPASELLFTRDDPSDPRLGELVRTDSASYAQARAVLLGCPQDEGVRRNRGRVGAAEGPAEIRRAFYRLTPFGLDATGLFDLGDTIIQPTLEETHEIHREIVSEILRNGKQVIVLGGGNDISYPDCAAATDQFLHPLIFNIDAHFDVRDDNKRNSGTPYRQLLDEGAILPEKFFEMAYQPASNSSIYHDYLVQKGVVCISLRELRSRGLVLTFQEILGRNRSEAIFWGFDLDAVRTSDAPGVSAPNPTGMSGVELCELARLAGATRETRIVEFTEVNPKFDIDGRTSRLVAVAIHSFLEGVAQ